MQPSDRTIRDELRREALRVPIPNTMWSHIADRLDADDAKAKRLAVRREQWKPALAFGVAAGIFWLTVIPYGRHMDRFTPQNPLPGSAVVTENVQRDVTTDELERKFQSARLNQLRLKKEPVLKDPRTGFSAY